MEELEKKIDEKVSELEFLIIELPTMEEVVKVSKRVVAELERFKDYSEVFAELKK